MGTQTWQQTLPLAEYLRAFHTRPTANPQGEGGLNGIDPMGAYQQYDQFGNRIQGQYSNPNFYDPSQSIEQWAGGRDINALLSESRGVNGGRYGTDAEGANVAQWAPRYDPATGQVTFQVQDGGDEMGELIMAGLAAGVGGLSGGFGLSELFGGGLGGGGGAGLGALEEAAMLGGGLGSSGPIAPGLGGLGGLGDPSWGVNQGLGAAEEAAGLGGGLGDAGAIAPGNGAGPGAGWDYNDFLREIGIDGNGTQFSGGTQTNADIMKGIMGGGGLNVPSGAGSLISRLLGGNPSTSDIASLLGTLGSTGLGILGSNQQGDALRDIANQARTDRLPFLNQATQWFNDPSSYYNGAPAQAAMGATLRGLSVNGNPLGSGTSLALANEAGLRGWQNAWTGAANIGLGGQDSRNQLLSNAATSDLSGYANLAKGLGAITSPADPYADFFRRYGINTGAGLT